MSCRRHSAIAVLAALLAATATQAADLEVSVTALRSDAGTVHVAIYDSAEGFPNGQQYLFDRVVPAKTGFVAFVGLKPGTYAIAVYHDENGNNDFDQNFIGFPLEGYAFSNGAKPFLGPPDFSDAAFEVGPEGARITVPMTYW